MTTPSLPNLPAPGLCVRAVSRLMRAPVHAVDGLGVVLLLLVCFLYGLASVTGKDFVAASVTSKPVPHELSGVTLVAHQKRRRRA